MITADAVRLLIAEKISGSDKFIVDISVSSGNKIIVEIDSPEGIKISDITGIHRFIESRLDRNVEDYELTVSSPGLEEPFKIVKQYQKNLGRNVKIVLKTGIVIEGELTETDENNILITQRKKEKIDGKNQWNEKKIPVEFGQIIRTTLVL